MNRLVESVATFVTPEMEARGIQLRTSLGLLPMTRVDENRIKQVLLNLLLNAAQAMPETRPARDHPDRPAPRTRRSAWT